VRLIGAILGWGYAAHPDNLSAAYWDNVLLFACREHHVTCSDLRVKARFPECDEKT
jgi:hypothetical protein